MLPIILIIMFLGFIGLLIAFPIQVLTLLGLLTVFILFPGQFIVGLGIFFIIGCVGVFIAEATGNGHLS